MEKDELVYSFDGQMYGNWEFLMHHLRNCYEPGVARTVYQATPIYPKNQIFFNFDLMIENMHESAYQDHGEYSEEKNILPTLREHIETLLDEMLPVPAFYSVKNVKEITVTVEEE